MSPYRFDRSGGTATTVHIGAVCAHDRAVTQQALQYWDGDHAYRTAHGPWKHDDDGTECDMGPAKEFRPQ